MAALYLVFVSTRVSFDEVLALDHLQVPERFCGLPAWLSGEVRLCRRPTSSEGEVGSEETGGVWARRLGTRVVVG